MLIIPVHVAIDSEWHAAVQDVVVLDVIGQDAVVQDVVGQDEIGPGEVVLDVVGSDVVDHVVEQVDDFDQDVAIK